MTTSKRPRPNRQMGMLKLAVAAGSLAASLLGTRLLAQQDEMLSIDSVQAVSPDPIIINVPISVPSSGVSENVVVSEPAPAPIANNNTSTEQVLSLNLAPIPQAVSPQIQAAPPPAAVSVQPVASSTSSK